MGQGLSACLVSASLMEEKSVSAIPRGCVGGEVTNDWCIFWLGRAMPVIPNLKDRGK